MIPLRSIQKRIFFCGELISNASDALDKLRFEALTDIALIPSDHKYEIRLKPDLSARTLVISDSGIGMSRQELIDTIGQLRVSGTQEFARAHEGIAKLRGLPGT